MNDRRQYLFRVLCQSYVRSLLCVIAICVFVSVSAAAAMQSDKQLSLSSSGKFVSVGETVALEWKANYAPSEILLLYSTNDGNTWKEWQRFETSDTDHGTFEVPITWKQFTWYYFSYTKIPLILKPTKGEQMLESLLGRPLQFRAEDAQDPSVKVSDVVKVTVKGPPWWTNLFIGIFLFATLLYFLKASWDDGPRKDLSFIFNIACTACLVSKTTFLFAYGAYLIAGLALWHRFTIIKQRQYHQYWLTSVYSGVGYIFMIGFAILLVVGLILRVRDFLF